MTETQTPSLKPGTSVLGYQVLGLLAQGGMAEVYLARRGAGPPVVIKRIRPNLVSDPQFVRMFLDEASVARRLEHPNIVRVFDVGDEGGVHALVMEFLDGRNLLRVARACYQRRAYVPYELMGRIVADSLAGLEHAHTLRAEDGSHLNLVHRDMSPENIVITYEGQVKVVDFGIAKAANMEGRTQQGVIKGKLGYVAPEAITGEKLDGRADVFAMGVTLYELLTYTVPFSGTNEVEVLTAITTRDPQSPRALNPSVPVALDQICMRALEKNRVKRWASAGEMKNALETFVKGTGKGSTQSYVAAFMEALFPRGTDKERVRVAELQQAAPPARTRTPAAAPVVRDRAAENTQPGKKTGPAWSRALQLEDMVGGPTMPGSDPPQPAAAGPRPAPPRPPPTMPAVPAARVPPPPPAEPSSSDVKTQAVMLSSEEMALLQNENTGAPAGFDDGTEGATRVEDRAAVEAAIKQAMEDMSATAEVPSIAPGMVEPPVTSPGFAVDLESDPGETFDSPTNRGARVRELDIRADPPPPPSPGPPPPPPPDDEPAPPEPRRPAARPPPPPPPVTDPGLDAIMDELPPPPVSNSALEPIVETLSLSVRTAKSAPAAATPKPPAEPTVRVRADDEPAPPPPPTRRRRMHPIAAMLLGVFLAALMTAAGVAGGVAAGLIKLPASIRAR
ncbi:MAG: serine/threonine protein kinase [Deltaproteobacteria bacterium]|nr:serine/threonine protein kinase [Deltaproteobacteria bacterium]